MSLADIAASVARRSNSGSTATAVDPLTFIQEPWGLGLRLFPVQRVIIKAHYGMALDDNALGIPLDTRITRAHPDWQDSWAEFLTTRGSTGGGSWSRTSPRERPVHD